MLMNPIRINQFIILIATILTAISCAGIKEQAELKQARIIQNVPFYQQEEYQCGPASLAMVMSFHSVFVTPEEIAADIYSKSARGTLNLDMALYARRKGLSAHQYRGGLYDLKKNIDGNYPLIVLVEERLLFYKTDHFMVVVGYNDHGVIVNSGKKREIIIYEKDFLKAWEKTNYWTLLIRK
jgi:ABC-type bacteriocin/lantibiotic exporter with double-glycine peptidase domain